MDRKTGRADAEQVIRDLEVVTPSTEIPVRRLSGGNVQKVLLGREIKAGPNVIITAIVLFVSSVQNKRGSCLPASLGVNYFREER